MSLLAALRGYLARGIEVIVIPARNAAPRPNTPFADQPLSATYLKRVPCNGYLGPNTAGKISPARLATAELPAVAAVSTRLDEIAC